MTRRDVFEDPSLPSSVKLVYTALCMFADAETRICWPARERLAANTSLSVRTIATAIRIGEDCGLWDVARTQTSNRYRLHDRADDPARYLIGSGPQRPAGSHCTVDVQSLPSGRASVAHELDQRSRASTQRTTSGDAYAAGGRRASAPTPREIITDCRAWRSIDEDDVGNAAHYLIRCIYGVIESIGMEAALNARDQMARVLQESNSKTHALRNAQTWVSNLDRPGENGSSLVRQPFRAAS